MVEFKLVKQTERYLVYWYYPEGREEEGYGIIVVDLEKKSVRITKVAPGDIKRDLTSEKIRREYEYNKKIFEELGIPREFEEPDIPEDGRPLFTTVYGAHVIAKLNEAEDKGIILKEGMAAWF